MALLLVPLLAAPTARAFVRSVAPGTGACLFWNQRSIGWSLHVEGSASLGYDATRTAIGRSSATWAAVSCTDLEFGQQADATEPVVGASTDASRNRNVIVFRPVACDEVAPADAPCQTEGGCSNEFNCFDFGQNVIAVTTTSFRPNTGEILDADIEFNEASFRFTDVDSPPCGEGVEAPCVDTDLGNTATHEIGHLLGLDHSPVREATMFGSAPSGEITKRDLAEDDEEGICSIYPAGAPPNSCVTDTGGEAINTQSGCSCGSAGAGGGFTALVACLLLRGLWRKRGGEGPRARAQAPRAPA
jgi:hypothetical protein